jgi:Pentatricopeptide repeat domain
VIWIDPSASYSNRIQKLLDDVESKQRVSLDTGIREIRSLLDEAKIQQPESITLATTASFLDLHSIAITTGNDKRTFETNRTQIWAGSPASAEQWVNELRNIPYFKSQWRASDWTFIYNIVLKAYKSEAGSHATYFAEKLLQTMELEGLADIVSYTTVITTLANMGDKSSAERAQDIFDRIVGAGRVAPNVQTYNSLVKAWVNCNELDRAERLLTILEQSPTGDAANGDFNSARIHPSVVTYSTIMNGYTRQRDIETNASIGMPEAIRTFRRMFEAYEQRSITACRPNLHSYVTLINGCKQHVASLSGLSSDQLSRLDAQFPGFLSASEAAETAESALLRLYKEFEELRLDELKPNIQLITTVIDCWKLSGRPDAGDRAEYLLNWALELHNIHNDPTFEPTAYTFVSAITAWGKSRRLGKASRGRKILERMIELHHAGVLSAPPTTHCYTAVINGCAYCENDEMDKRHALQIAVQTYKDLQSHRSSSLNQHDASHRKLPAPNEISYTAFLTAVRNLSSDGVKRAAAIFTVFESAITDGMVSDLVLHKVKAALSPEQLGELLRRNGGLTVKEQSGAGLDRNCIEKIPDSWRRNVSTAR